MSVACTNCGSSLNGFGDRHECNSSPRNRVVEIRLPFADLDLTRFGSRTDFECVGLLDAVVVAGVTLDDVAYCRLEDKSIHDDAGMKLGLRMTDWLLALNVGGNGPLWEQICDWVLEENRQRVEELYREGL